MPKLHYTYILKCSDGTFYIGYATDIERRLLEHNGESKIAGAKYTRGRRPVRLVHQESFSTRSEALQREAALKKLARSEKQLLVKRNTQGTSAIKKKSAL